MYLWSSSVSISLSFSRHILHVCVFCLFIFFYFFFVVAHFCNGSYFLNSFCHAICFLDFFSPELREIEKRRRQKHTLTVRARVREHEGNISSLFSLLCPYSRWLNGFACPFFLLVCNFFSSVVGWKHVLKIDNVYSGVINYADI